MSRCVFFLSKRNALPPKSPFSTQISASLMLNHQFHSIRKLDWLTIRIITICKLEGVKCSIYPNLSKKKSSSNAGNQISKSLSNGNSSTIFNKITLCF